MENNYENVKNIINILKYNKQTISFAESCTGGLIASSFTAISGSSAVFNGSCVTYSNEIKHNWLGVSNEILENFGAVSKECVEEMLHGIQKMSNCDYASAVSGIAGPDGGTELKPVGTVFIGLLTPTKIEVERCFFKGSRNEIQNQAANFAIAQIEDYLK